MAAAMAARMAAARSRAGGAAAVAAAAARSTSSRVIAPSGPVPRTAPRSTCRSAASVRGQRRDPLARRRRRRQGGGRRGGDRRLAGSADPGEDGADRHLLARLDQQRSTTPLSKISTSITPFSVSTSATMSPRLTASPGCFRQSTRVPASMSAPSVGMRNSAMAPHHLSTDATIVSACGSAASSRCFGIRHRHLGAAHARHRRIELVERPLHDARARSRPRGCRSASLRRRSRARCVFATEARIVSVSSGRSVRRSMTSASIPSRPAARPPRASCRASRRR